MQRIRPASRLSSAVLAALVATVLVAGGCKKKAPPPAPPTPAAAPTTAPPVIAPKPEPPPPPLTEAQKVKIAAEFEAARKIVAEADSLGKEGLALEKAKGRMAANDTLVAAKKKYMKAIGDTGKWVDPEENQVTQAQVDRDPELMKYAAERGRWIQRMGGLGMKLDAK